MPKIGDVVLIKEDLPRGRWNNGRIVDSVKSTDRNVRSLKVKLKTGRVIGRPLNLLFPIEVSHNDDLQEKETLPLSIPACEKRRPIRHAAEKAK